jgi:hypothetical protein
VSGPFLFAVKFDLDSCEVFLAPQVGDSHERRRNRDRCEVPSLPRRRHGCRRAAGEERAILAQPAALPGVRGHGPRAEAQAPGMSN